MSTPYDDIINLPHYVSDRRRQMPMEARAAQFAPFAALSGYGDAVAETARTTSAKLDLSDDEKQELSRKIAYALSFADRPMMAITYFRPDCSKRGGEYVTVYGHVKKVEECINLLTLTDGTGIALDAVSDISGEIFEDL